MRSDAIQRVSRALAARIETALPTISGKSKTIVAPPNKDNVAAAQIVLFPYRLVVNAALRNSERVLPPADPQSPPLVFNDALPLDVFYLLTAGTSQPDDLESLVWLGMAMQIVQRDPNLVGPLVDGDTVRISLEPAPLDEMNRVWAMFPDADYRTSVVYVASPVWIDPLGVEVAAPVIDDQRRFAQQAA
jgi:hypothetical protein